MVRVSRELAGQGLVAGTRQTSTFEERLVLRDADPSPETDGHRAAGGGAHSLLHLVSTSERGVYGLTRIFSPLSTCHSVVV